MSGNTYSKSGVPRFEALEQRLLLDAGQVVINEVMYHPGFGEPGQTGYVAENVAEEFVELYNRGPGGVNLKDWKFTQGIAFTLPDVTVAQGGYLVVAADVAAFRAKCPSVDPAKIVGGWTGQLGNNGNNLELEDALGNRVDFVSYSNEGDWAQRLVGDPYPGQDWWKGWKWSTAADAGGKSLELINPALTNECGQNWTASITDQGTPGAPNSTAAADIAPMIISTQHYPYIPKSSEAVTITALIVDEQATGLAVSLYHRVDANPKNAFVAEAMVDDGLHGDGAAGDGVYGIILPAQANRTTVEFYIRAQDGTGHSRTWPGPTNDPEAQSANALYQVDDTVYTGSQPVYRLIIPAYEWTTWTSLMGGSGRWSNATMNGTLVTVDGTGSELRYNVGVRNRGAGTRSANPHNLQVNIPNDRPWHDLTRFELNTRTVQSQLAGNAVFLAAGLLNAYGAAVQIRVNGNNLANAIPTGGTDTYQYGSYYMIEPYGSEWARDHMPEDPSGNIYKGVWYIDGQLLSHPANLADYGTNLNDYRYRYAPTGPSPSTCGGYSKQTNTSADDWSDLLNLVQVLNATYASDADYAAAVSQVADVDQWLRHFAVTSLMGNMETTLATGTGDDYSMVRSAVDGRWQLLPHDMDTVLGQGDATPDSTRSIFYAARDTNSAPALRKFLKNPVFVPRYYAILKDLMDTVFSPAQMNGLLDTLFANWSPDPNVQAAVNTAVQGMKDFVVQRNANVLTQISLEIGGLAIVSGLDTVNSLWHTTTGAGVSFSGRADAINTRRVLVNGIEATWSAWEAKFTAGNVALNPGINRVVIQALDGDGKEIDRSAVDIWYEKTPVSIPAGTITGTVTWTAAGGPYLVAGAITIPAGSSLTIEAGTTVYFAQGASITVNGKLIAQGVEQRTPTPDYRRIRFTRQPGTTNTWGGIRYSATRQDNVLAYADIEYASSAGQVVDSHDSRLLIDHVTFANNDTQTFDIWNAQFILRNSVLGDVDAHYIMKAQGMPADGWFIVDSNLVGVCGADADIMHLNGVSRKGGPVAQVTNNFFLGGGDDIIDDNETDTYIAGNFFGRCNLGNNGRSAGAAVTTGPYVYTFPQSSSPSDTSTLNFSASYNLVSQRLVLVGNVFFDSETGLLVKTGAWASLYNNVFIRNADGAITFDELNRALCWQGGDCFPGRGVDVHNSIFLDNGYYNSNGQWIDRTFEYVDNIPPDPLLPDEYRDPDAPGTPQVIVENSIVPARWLGYGTGNIEADPRFAYVPPSRTNFSPSLARFRTGYNGFDASPYVPAGQAPDVHLEPGSPAIGAGTGGTDMGIYVPGGAWVSGEPASPTWLTDATLNVAGADPYGYKYRVLKDGEVFQPWSDEIARVQWVTVIARSGTTVTATVPGHGYLNGDVLEVMGVDTAAWNGTFTIFNVTANTFDYTIPQAADRLFPADNHLDITVRRPEAIHLTALTSGTYTVEVLKKGAAIPGTTMYGVQPWQDAANATAVTWTVDTSLAPHVRLSEVLADNASAVPHGALWPDVVELYNDGHGTVTLTGMSLTDDPLVKNKFVFGKDGDGNDVTLAQGAYKVLYGGTDTVTPDDHLGFSLKGNGDTLYLYDSGGNLVGSVTFGIQLPDRSIARKADGTWGLAQPTFGAANTLLPTGDPGALKVNEWLTDGVVRFDQDFIEIYNPEPVPVDMGGLYLTDNPIALAHQKALHEANPAVPTPRAIAPLSFIAASPVENGQALGGYAVFSADNDPGQGADHTDFKLSPHYGMVGLLDAGGATIDRVVYGPQRTDVSQGRLPLGSPTFGTSSIPTPGLENPGVLKSTTSTVDVPIFDIANSTYKWRYSDTGTNLHTAPGTKWYEFGYNDSAWGLSSGILNYERDTTSHAQTFPSPWTVGKVLAANPANTYPWSCYYFRTHFTFSGDPATVTTLQGTDFLDDGAALYLNGVEIERLYINDGITLVYDTLANTNMSGTATLRSYSIPLAGFPGLLRQGENVLAVEVHQQNTGSSDITWACSLTARAMTETIVRQVTLPANIVALANDLRITELMYNAVNGSDFEYIELKNTSATTTLDLAGVRLTNGVDYVFSDADPNRMLAPGAYIVVAANEAKFRTRYGVAPVLAAGVYSGKLSDNGENVTLKLPAPYEAAMLRFDYSPTWYPQASGGGCSIVIVSPTGPDYSWDQKQSWKASAAVNGSPGADEPLPSSGTVLITELMTHSDQDPPEGIGDWIELHNTSLTDPVDISGWYLSDTGADLQLYQIGLDTVLGPNEYKVFTERDDFGEFFALSELGEEVHLTNPAGTYHEIANFTAAEREVTFGRFTNSIGVTEYVPMDHATLGLPNSAPKIGPVILSEIMYHPPANGDEFIELKNTTATGVLLYDPLNPANGWQFTNGIEFAFSEGDFVPADGYALVVGGDPEAFRAKYGIPDSVPIYGPYGGNLENAGETVSLKKPGDPEPDTGFVPYYLVDHVLYDNDPPWPASPGGTGPSLVRANESGYGNEVLSWAAGPAYGTPGGVAGAAAPRVVGIRLNGRDRGASAVDPSGLGVRTLEVRFSKAVAYLQTDVTVQTVTFEGDVENVVAWLTPTVGVGGTDTMTISLDAGAAWDTWVKVRLSGSGTLKDLMSHLLDGEPAAGGSGLGYLYAAADLPSGDGLQGGDAVFYVGSLRGDMDLDRAITPDDKAAFAARWRDQDLDADFRGVGFGVRPPDGRVTIADINGFTSAYQAGLAANKELAALPGTGGGPAGGAMPLPSLEPAGGEDLLAMAAGQVGPLLALAAPAPLGESPGRPAADTPAADPLQVRKPVAAATGDEGPMPVLRI